MKLAKCVTTDSEQLVVIVGDDTVQPLCFADSMLNCLAIPFGSFAVTGQTRKDASRSRNPRLL